ncbi:dTMP kinase [Sphingosinithalassobacter portus]|uniref:dTMP kinase n=1 Tax=Stakelama portus TaxID=2676234 RepID=UPI000D6EAFAD|nr:dTMP kinase [Sphingosinithalassobacter portus]
MGLLVAIEGADGVGKNTTANALRDTLAARGRSAELIAFPRYGETVAGVTIGRFLAGELPVPMTVEAAAVLYALDRLEWRDTLNRALATNDVVVLDRYVASNMAYQGAKVPPGEARALMDWIRALEIDQFALPLPALNIYLDTPWELAREMILKKAQRSYTDRSYDVHEEDVALQQRVRANYEAIAAAGLLGSWRIVQASQDGAMRPTAAIVADIMAAIDAL